MQVFKIAILLDSHWICYFVQPPPVLSRNGVIRGYFVVYRENNKYYRGKNLTVNGGNKRNYLIGNLHPYKEYIIEIQAFTRAGVSPSKRAEQEVQTLEDGMSKCEMGNGKWEMGNGKWEM